MIAWLIGLVVLAWAGIWVALVATEHRHARRWLTRLTGLERARADQRATWLEEACFYKQHDDPNTTAPRQDHAA